MPKESMNLVRYCKHTHVEDVINKGKILVGTFAKYKRIENEALRDPEEGQANPAIFDEEQEVVLTEEDNDSMLEHSSIKLANGWKLQVPKGMPLWLDEPYFNTFVLCTSLEDNPSLAKAERLGYENFYKITHPFNFGQAIMWSLMKHLKSEFGITGYMGIVNYVPRKIRVINKSNPGPPLKSFSSSEFFTKHEKFIKDNEFRYVFLEFSNKEKTQFNSFNLEELIVENKEISKWVVRA